ncbi:ABC transporter substrate-binding protein [Brevibacillus sp. B_LB10_24]|uniref:ABC transporter substrate-binding protein n=1 Tax=Brevibacillus sp. B_LB10_24 TaxID=3380645 RepID=UPI0038BC23DC
MNVIKWLGMAAVPLLAAMGALTGCSSGAGSAAEEIRIGAIAPLTGPAANAGVALQQGIELAVEEWNAKGGIEVDGKKLPIKVFFEDSQSKPEQGVSGAEKLINQQKVHLLIGDAFASSVTMSVMDLASQYEVPILSGEPVSEAIAEKVEKDPEKYKFFWKGNFGSSAYAETVFETYKYLEANKQYTPKTKTVAFVVEDTDYGRSNADLTGKLFEQDGWKIAAAETVQLGYTDFYPQLSKLNSLKPDVIVTCFTSVASGVAFVKQFQETKVDALHLAIYYPVRPEFIEQAGTAANNLIWTPLSYDPNQIERQKKFDESIQNKYKVASTSDHASGYDAMANALTSIEKAKSLDSTKIAEQLSQLEREGLLGKYVFDQKNHQIKSGAEFLPVPAAQIQNGENKLIWPENVSTANPIPQPWVK